MGNLLKDYYDAMTSGSEWAAEDAEKIRKKIKDREEEASWNGRKTDYEYSNEMGG